MLTLESILRTTRHQAAFGELRLPPVPRDKSARPSTKPAAQAESPAK